MDTQELTPKEKQEALSPQEQTRPGRYYVPDVDIYETADAIWLLADLPGVAQDDITVQLEEGTLTISGQVSVEDYEALKPIYTEYRVGHFVRRFSLPDAGRLDQTGIDAKLVDGVLRLRIPKAEKAKARRIEVRGGD